MKWTLTAFLFYVFITMPITALGEETSRFTVITHNAPNWAETNNKGFAYELNNALAALTDVQFELVVLPFARALKVFQQPAYDCYFGGNADNFIDIVEVLVDSSYPVVEDKLHLFTIKGVQPINTMSELKGLTIAVPSGHELLLDPEILKQITSVQTRTADNAFKMLQAGRVDALFSFKGGMTTEILGLTTYNEDLSFMSIMGHFNCKPGPRADTFLAAINKALEQGHKDKAFDDIYRRFSRIIPDYYSR